MSIGQFLYGIPNKEKEYILITTTSKSSRFGRIFKNRYVTITGDVNKPRYKSTSQGIDLSTNTGSAVVKVEGVTSYYLKELKIIYLDLTENPSLTHLNCSKNKLTSLDLTKNTRLISLHCQSNQLTALDVTQNPSLTSLDCYNNQLTTLEVTKNLHLEWLFCYNNQLTILDVSNNTNLEYLYCYSNPNLTTIYINSTQKQKLDNNQLPNWHKDSHTNYVVI